MLGVVGHEQQLQPVREPILVNAFDRCDRLHAGRQRLRQKHRAERRAQQKHQDGGQETRGFRHWHGKEICEVSV